MVRHVHSPDGATVCKVLFSSQTVSYHLHNTSLPLAGSSSPQFARDHISARHIRQGNLIGGGAVVADEGREGPHRAWDAIV